MSEQQNTTLIQSLYDAFGRGDVQTILNSLTDDVQWALEGPVIIPFAGQRRGISQVRSFFEALATTQTGRKLNMEPFIAQGDQVAAYGRYSCTVTATGKKLDCPIAHFFTIRNGKVSRFVDLTDTAAVADAYQSASAAAR